jgi:hypothetical protein
MRPQVAHSVVAAVILTLVEDTRSTAYLSDCSVSLNSNRQRYLSSPLQLLNSVQRSESLAFAFMSKYQHLDIITTPSIQAVTSLHSRSRNHLSVQEPIKFRLNVNLASLRMLTETDAVEATPKTQVPKKKRQRGFGSNLVTEINVPNPVQIEVAMPKSRKPAPADRVPQEAPELGTWAFDSQQEPSDAEDSDSTMDPGIDALATIRREPHKPRGARWRSRAANDDTSAAAAPASRRASVLSSTSRRANHDYAVAELLRTSTVLVRGKAAAAPISTSHELYTNPGVCAARRRPAPRPAPQTASASSEGRTRSPRARAARGAACAKLSAALVHLRPARRRIFRRENKP